MPPANDDLIDKSAMTDEAQATRVGAVEQDQVARAPSGKIERRELSDFNLFHTVAVHEDYAVEADPLNEKVRRAYKGKGKDKTEVGFYNFAESRGWIETSEKTLSDLAVIDEKLAKDGDLQAQARHAERAA